MWKNGKAPNAPRLCREERRLHRFYEPLLLLHILDRNGEERISRGPSQSPVLLEVELHEFRRRFLDQLAYVCDHVKGGDTVTAVALEFRPSEVTFWLSSNTGPSVQVQSFLQGLLDALQNAPSSAEGKARLEAWVTQQCMDFNIKRIKAYCNLLQGPLNLCRNLLGGSEKLEDILLAEWLEKFQNLASDPEALSFFAAQERSSISMKVLQKHTSNNSSSSVMNSSRGAAFAMTRHYIGRLGSHLRAARVITTAAYRLPNLFESFTIRTLSAPKPASLPPPADHKTTLDGIIRRMLPANSDEVQKYQESLAAMDAKFNILERLQQHYQSKTFRPRVHAELRMLEYFYANNLPFCEDDRYIGCSKPACYCCYHYISIHPGGFVRPASHGIRYISWRQPDPLNPDNKREEKHRLEILNQLTAQIRLDALRQIINRRGPGPWRPDSTTGITQSPANTILAQTLSDEHPDTVFEDSKSRESEGPTFDSLAIASDNNGESSNSDSDGGVLI